MSEAYIVSAVRTAGGRRGGRLSGWHPADLAAQVLNSVVDRINADPALIDDVIMGCVGQAGEQSVNIGRNAVMSSKLPDEVPATSIDRQCGSSQQAVHFAAMSVMSGYQDIVIAAGVESMTRVPMGAPTTLALKAGMGGPNGKALLERFNNVIPSQFTGAEMIAKKHGLTREVLDAFGYKSHLRAIAATKANAFDAEILPIEIILEDGSTEMHTVDEGIRFDATLEAMQGVKLLTEGGVITAATASQICDGASAVMVVNEKGLKKLGVEPLARIHHLHVTGGDPVVMLEAPIPATQQALKRVGMSINDIDLYEVNEAFAPIPLAWLKTIGADSDRLNVNGGAIALGHPLGSSGTKLMTTLLHALKARGKRYGLQTMCEGGGMANVTILEAL